MSKDKLGDDRTDMLASLTKGVLGAVPVIGPIAAEIVGVVIPEQRLDRIKRFLVELEKRVKDVEQQELRAKCSKEEFVDLLEDGFWQAARALSKDRLEHIASIIANGLKDEDVEYIKYKKLLSLLEQLNDNEVLFLIMYGKNEYGDQGFMDEHPEILKPIPIHSMSPDDEIEQKQIQDSYKSKLAGLGLIKPRFKKPKKGELPEFDIKTGMVKASGYELTTLGRMLLKMMDQKSFYNRTE